MEVFFEPAVPATTVRDNVLFALETFKTTLGFDSMLYTQKLLDAVMSASGVTTVKLNSLTRKGNSDMDFKPVDVFTVLESGYYEYDGECSLILTSVKELR